MTVNSTKNETILWPHKINIKIDITNDGSRTVIVKKMGRKGFTVKNSKYFGHLIYHLT